MRTAYGRHLHGRAATWLLLCMLACTASASDWPVYMHDAAHSGVTTESLPSALGPLWVHVNPHEPRPAWTEAVKETPRVRFDDSYRVAVADGRVFFGSSADDQVYALDAATGELLWTAFTGGPVRAAPAYVNGHVYAGSDDGFAYCFNAVDGALVWRVRGAYDDERLLGNGRMISRWPVRTGVAAADGVAYFGAGLFPHEGIFLCAVDAATGALQWRNDTVADTAYAQPFGGLSPQGPLAVTDNLVIVPCGRGMPFVFNRDDGTLAYICEGSGKVGGAEVMVTGDYIVAGAEEKQAFSLATGEHNEEAPFSWFPGLQLAVDGGMGYLLAHTELRVLDLELGESLIAKRQEASLNQKVWLGTLRDLRRQSARLKGEEKATANEQTMRAADEYKKALKSQRLIEEQVVKWRLPVDASRAMILAGDTLVLGGDGEVAGVDVAGQKERWGLPVEGRATGLAVADGRLYASTTTGRIYCFGAGDGAGVVKESDTLDPYQEDALSIACAEAAEAILAATQKQKGYCLIYGSGDGRLAHELAKRTDLSIIGIEPDAGKAERSKEMLAAEGLHGVRVVIDTVSFTALPYASYFADLVVFDGFDDPRYLPELLRVLKPHGGMAWLASPDGAAKLSQCIQRELEAVGSGSYTFEAIDETSVRVVRGPLEGEGAWTHLYGNPANTGGSAEQRVSGPLGVLWFGRPGPEKMVERHARAAAPLAQDGRMFIQGGNKVMAFDAYNGTPLWERDIPGATRVRVDADQTNMVLGPEAVYVAVDDKCLRLDPTTGDVLRTLTVPPEDGQRRRWGYVSAAGGVLLGSSAEPFQGMYGSAWDDLIADSGAWRDPGNLPAPLDEHSKPDEDARAAFWGSALSWQDITQWPAKNSVRTAAETLTPRMMTSGRLFALDPDTGEKLWMHQGQRIAHPAIAIGGELVFLADAAVSPEERQRAVAERAALVARGEWRESPDGPAPPDRADVRRVTALDLQTGAVRWERALDLTGCGGDRMGLAYYDDVLLFFGGFSNHDSQFYREGALAWRRITALDARDGAALWSKPLEYLRRPVVMGDEILIEPYFSNLRTGDFKARPHPVTGVEERWQFARPGHSCGVTTAAADTLFLRGSILWSCDMNPGLGMQPFGGMRTGCWVNVIPANGLLLFPEASAGCQCSYPVRTTVALAQRQEDFAWRLFVQEGDLTPVEHLAVNFGAPGDWRADDGTVWFAYPHPLANQYYDYSVRFRLRPGLLPAARYFNRGLRAHTNAEPREARLFTSGCTGMTGFVLPLREEGQGPARYTIRVYLSADGGSPGACDIRLGGKTVLSGFDSAADQPPGRLGIVKEFTGINADGGLLVEIEPNPGLPVIHAVEALREPE